MIEVFKTNVETARQATALVTILCKHLPSAEINFDLEDCDSILRVKAEKISRIKIVLLLASMGFDCQLLDY
jgi:tRNA G26 N,N-dimethylase Trm1